MAHTMPEVIILIHNRSYKQYTLFLLIVTVIALVVCAASLSLKQKETLAVQGNAEQNHVEYYTSKASSSQENSESPERNSGLRPTTPPPSSTASKPEEEKESYLVTVHEGKIGVFRSGESEPFLTADVDVYLLPAEDLSLLRKGIRAESFGAVKSILEDYE